MTNAAIERRQGDALSQIVGTGDTRAALATLEQNVRDIIDVARDRGFVRSYGDGPHEFYGMPAWQLLGMTYGLVPFVEWTKPTDNGWEARAVVKTRDGQEVAAAEAMCTREEGNRRNASAHVLRAMAQTRAQRNALRSALGAALVLAGFDFPDPEAPATNDQVAVLHILEREIGWDHDQGHVEAGDVASYKDLTREQASELIERWTALRDNVAGGQAPRAPIRETGTGSPSPQMSDASSPHFPTSDTGESGNSSEQEAPEEPSRQRSRNGEGAATPKVPSGAPDLDELWKQAIAAGLTIKRAKPFAASQGIVVNAAHELTAEQMTVLLEKWRERGK